MNQVLPVFRRSGTLPVPAKEIQIGVMPGSFPIALDCQVKEPVLNGFDLPVAHRGISCPPRTRASIFEKLKAIFFFRFVIADKGLKGVSPAT